MDVVVIGLGGWGSATLWRLAERGVDTVGVEQHGIGHDQGSSHGQTRLFRVACKEHPGLVPIALKSLELWTGLGAETGEVLVRQTGCLGTGSPDSKPVRGSIMAATAGGVPVRKLDHDELVARQPQYAGLAPDDVAVWDPGGGICYPERNVRAQVAAGERLGAKVRPNTTVRGIEERSDGVIVYTDTAELRAAQVVITAGAALGTLVPELPVTPRPTPVTWFRPRDPQSDEFTLARFPAFTWSRSNGKGLWGHGSDEGYRVKVGIGRASSPDTVLAELSAAVAEALPGLDPQPVEVKPCIVTDSPDDQFVVGRLTERIIVAGGDSGHGFKHSAGIGELLAQVVTGEPTYCATDFLDPRRFA